jgi:hypothetical protein
MTKKNFILGIILILLVGTAYVYNGPWRSWQEKNSQTKNIFAQLNVDKINKIEITASGKTTTLDLNGNKWKIAGTKDFYVNETMASNMITRLKDLTTAQLEIASENKDKKAEFGVDDASGVVVKFKQGDKELSSLIVGKMASDYTSNYFSIPNSDKTYLTKVDLYSVFAGNNWYDKTIFASDKTKINKLKLQVADKEFKIAKQGNDWQTDDTKKTELNLDKVNSIVDLMASLIASEIPEQDVSKTGFEKSTLIVQATGDGVDNTLTVGNDNGKGLFYAKKNGSENIYLIAKAERDKLNVQIKDLQ